MEGWEGYQMIVEMLWLFYTIILVGLTLICVIINRPDVAFNSIPFFIFGLVIILIASVTLEENKIE